MWKVALIPLIPFALAAFNHYLNHKRQVDREKENQRRRPPPRTRKKEITCDHQWPDDEE